jgi:ubiquinone/menaquinone biosynthesis C-methylase UbiE
MNERHLQLCASVEWADMVRQDILPWALDGRELGDDVLEVGPGPGRTTDVLRANVARLTAVEVDQHLATALAQRLLGSNVDVVHADGTNLPFDDARFSAATSFTMLHHVPSPAQQDKLLAELRRVLQPGGLLIGVDSIETAEWRELHAGDTCVPVDPATLPTRLERAGFVDVEVEMRVGRASPDHTEPSRRFRFAARAPAG